MDGLQLQQVPPPVPGDLPVPPAPDPGGLPEPIGDPTQEPPPISDPDVGEPGQARYTANDRLNGAWNPNQSRLFSG